MKLIACCKVVHDEQDITTRPDRTLATDNAGLKISLYDLNAVETAVEIASTLGDSTVTALSVGTSAMVENAKIKKIFYRVVLMHEHWLLMMHVALFIQRILPILLRKRHKKLVLTY